MSYKDDESLEEYLDRTKLVECPECLKKVNQDELDTFGGVCEECSGAFDEDEL